MPPETKSTEEARTSSGDCVINPDISFRTTFVFSAGYLPGYRSVNLKVYLLILYLPTKYNITSPLERNTIE